MSYERATTVAIQLMKLGVSQAGVAELLGRNSLEVIEAQLSYLPYRKARRPEAFIIEAVRNNFSPPRELYAKTHAQNAAARNPLDEGSQHPDRPVDADLEGYGAETPPGLDQADGGLGSAEPTCDYDLSEFDETDR